MKIKNKILILFTFLGLVYGFTFNAPKTESTVDKDTKKLHNDIKVSIMEFSSDTDSLYFPDYISNP